MNLFCEGLLSPNPRDFRFSIFDFRLEARTRTSRSRTGHWRRGEHRRGVLEVQSHNARPNGGEISQWSLFDLAAEAESFAISSVASLSKIRATSQSIHLSPSSTG